MNIPLASSYIEKSLDSTNKTLIVAVSMLMIIVFDFALLFIIICREIWYEKQY
jgi:hypothetical protein